MLVKNNYEKCYICSSPYFVTPFGHRISALKYIEGDNKINQKIII